MFDKIDVLEYVKSLEKFFNMLEFFEHRTAYQKPNNYNAKEAIFPNFL